MDPGHPDGTLHDQASRLVTPGGSFVSWVASEAELVPIIPRSERQVLRTYKWMQFKGREEVWGTLRERPGDELVWDGVGMVGCLGQMSLGWPGMAHLQDGHRHMDAYLQQQRGPRVFHVTHMPLLENEIGGTVAPMICTLSVLGQGPFDAVRPFDALAR